MNAVSNAPLESSLAIRPRAVPFTLVNEPPIRIFPSGCNAMARTAPLGPMPASNVASTEPSTFRRAMRGWGEPLKVVKSPPMRIFPSS